MRVPFFEFLQGLGVSAIVVLMHTEVGRIASTALLRQLSGGLVFGLGAVLAMAQSHWMTTGLSIDPRVVFVALAGPFAGPWAAVVAGTIAVGFRLGQGGAGAPAGAISIAVVTCGAFWLGRRLTDASKIGLRQLTLLAGLVAASTFVGLLLPAEARHTFFQDIAPVYVLGNAFGILTLGYLLAREARRAVAEDEVRQAAFIDQLTGLPNRRAFDDFVAEIERSDKSIAAVIMVDLDGFKYLNDMNGHEAGDAGLIGVAEAMRILTPERCLSARLGGDEFAMVMPRCDLLKAQSIARSLEEVISTMATEVALPLGATTGVAVGPSSMIRLSLLQEADNSLYAAKRLNGRRRQAA